MRIALLALVGCASGVRSPPSGIRGEEDAVRAFRAAWERDVRPSIADRADPLLRRIDDRMQSVDALGVYHAEQQPCAKGVEAIEDLQRLGHSFVVHGTIAALRGADRCWAVLFLGGMKLDLHGWLDGDGHLLVAWRIPEG